MFSNIKRRVGVISAVAVLAALVPVLAASPASAALKSGTLVVAPAADATFDSCPGTSAAAAGFTDTTSTDVDCIKTHGITSGVTATTYEPAGSVPRWQMALFLTRFATSAGMTLGSGADQGFTDISGHSAEIQTAINQIKQLGVTTGTTATTYSPDSNVTREQMAMFVERLLGKATPGPGACQGIAADGTFSSCTAVSGVTNINVLSSGIANVAHWNYTDIDSGNVTYEGHNAIVEIYHLGVPGDDKTATTFRPSADLTRAEMATWMKNALDHTNARPEGLHLQVSLASGFGAVDTALTVSHRDASRNPVTGTLVDVFSDVVTVLTNSPAFSAAGSCNTGNTVHIGGATECGVALGDASTDVQGNVNILKAAVADVGEGTTVNYYAWTGATGASYNNLTAPGSTVSSTSSTNPTVLSVSTDINTNAAVDATDANHLMVAYGTTVNVTGQLQTSTGVAVAKPLIPVTIVETVTEDGDAGDGTMTNSGTGTLKSVTTTVLYTDANGAISYTMTQADPSAAVTTNRTQASAAITASPAAVNAKCGAGACVKVSFNDDASFNSSVTVVLDDYAAVGKVLAAGGLGRTATASVWDQYGVGRAGQTVTFEATTDDGGSDNLSANSDLTDDVTRVTDSSGSATLGFTDLETATAKETVYAWLDSATNVGARGDAGEHEANAVFYRLEATPTSGAEVDTNTGAAIGTTFIIAAGTDVVTWAADHGLAEGAAVQVTVAMADTSATPTDCGIKVGMVLYALEVADAHGGTPARTSKLATTRGGSSFDFAADADTCGADTPGQAKALETWNANDVFFEIMRWDNANNELIIREQTATAGNGAYDYFAFTYEADDQFMTGGDMAVSLIPGASPTAVSLAAFETALKSKTTLASGYTLGGTTVGDIYQLAANNHGDNPGISVIHLGN